MVCAARTSPRKSTWGWLGVFVVIVFATNGASSAGDYDPNQPYQAERSNPVSYDVDYSVVVTAPYKTKLLRVWLPIPPSDFGQEVTSGELNSFPVSVEPQVAAEEVFGNRFAYFEFANPKGAQIIRHRFQVKAWELRWRLDPKRIVAETDWPDSFAPYRRGEEQAVVLDDRLRSLALEIVPKPGKPLADFTAILGWANDNFTYDHADASLAASSLHAFEKRRGHCSDYHGFCASMGRALGYPTRVVYGVNSFPKNSPSHCKLEVFLPPYGWVSFDVSETQKMITAIKAKKDLDAAKKEQWISAAKTRLMDGFRDNTWFLQTRGTDYDLAPKASRRVPVVRTIYAEADGVPLRDPDPADPSEREFAWMTVADFRPDHAVNYPFEDFSTLDSASPAAAKDGAK